MIHNAKTCYYTKSNNVLLQKLKIRCVSSKKRSNISKKYQEMFDKLLPKFKKNMMEKEIQAKKKVRTLSNLIVNTSRVINTEINFNDMKKFMRKLVVKKSVDNNLIQNNDSKNSIYYSKKEKINNFAQNTDVNNTGTNNEINETPKVKIKYKIRSADKPKKLIFYDTGKYDIPLFTKIQG